MTTVTPAHLCLWQKVGGSVSHTNSYDYKKQMPVPSTKAMKTKE